MSFVSALSTHADSLQAVADVCERAPFEGAPDLALVFYSAHHLGAVAEVGAQVRKRFQPRCLLGCVGESIVGNDREVEDSPAVSLWLGRWPAGVTVETFHLALTQTADGLSLLGWPDNLLAADPAQSAVLLFGDPASFPVDLFLRRINEDHGALPVLGGMASGLSGRNECRLLRDDVVLDHGGVGVLLQGPIGLRTVVSQGCRPIGQHMVITRGHDNVIEELGGQPVLARLQDLWRDLSPMDRALFQQGLHVGLVINEYQSEFQRGDFLVRNVLGLDRESGAIAIGDRIRVGQTVQFHVRDAETADEDLRTLLKQSTGGHSAAALLFSCNGRGTRLFPEPHHDVRAIRTALGAVPLAGFFAAGELGPVGGQNFIHGFTASIALFEDPPGGSNS